MGIFKPVWMKKRLGDRALKRADAKISTLNGDKLAQAATEAPLSGIRARAVNRLDDQALLAEIAKNDIFDCDMVANCALRRLSDQMMLAEVAARSASDYIRTGAALKLKDQNAMAKALIMNKNNAKGMAWGLDSGSKYLMSKLTDEALLAEVAKNAELSDVAVLALDKLNNMDLIRDVRKNSKHSAVRSVAASKINWAFRAAGPEKTE